MGKPGKINKYILASSLAAIMTVMLFAWYSLDQYKENEAREGRERLETCILTFWQLLFDKGTDFRVVDGKLLAGAYPVNGNFELPDRVQELFGGVATIFMGDERVATNVLNADGKRAVGTRLEGPAYDAVFKQGKPFRGIANIFGVPYQTAYDPIRDTKGEVIGALFVGIKESEFLSRLNGLWMNLTLALFGAVSIFIVFMAILGQAMKRVEEETRNAYQQLLDIVDFLPDATFVVDKDRRVIAWNRAIEKMTGLNKEDVIGKGDCVYSIPFYGERRPVLIDLIDEEIETIKRKYSYVSIEGRTLFGETFIPSFRNGADCYLWATATPLFDVEGNQVGAIESIRDITEYRRAELEKFNLTVQLNQAHMMEELMVRLGHDLKTPLTPLCILLPLIMERVSDPSLKKMLDICNKNATSIKELTDKTRIFTNLSSDADRFEPGFIRLATVVDECLSAHGDALAGKALSCQNEIDPGLVVQAVPAQLSELFSNLISNSLRYSPEQGVIRITAEQDAEAVTVSVADNGIGLAPVHLERIFDEFYKVDESRHDLKSTGLGLSICRRIVRNHHGRIWAESAGPGHGTTVLFTLNRDSNGTQHGEKETAANG